MDAAGTPTPGVVVLDGVLDLATLPALHDRLRRAAESSELVVVDIDEVVVLDDAALGVLLGAAGQLRRRGGDLVVVASSDGLRERFNLTGFDRAVRVVDRIVEVGR